MNINMDSRFPTGPSTGGSAVRVTELGEEDPSVIASLMYTVHRLDRRDVKHIGCRQFGMQALLKGIYVHKDLLFLHISLANSSHVPFDIDFVRFKVVDKKVAKRTAQQETYIEPVRALNELRRIEGKGKDASSMLSIRWLSPMTSSSRWRFTRKAADATSGSISRTATWWTPDWWTNW